MKRILFTLFTISIICFGCKKDNIDNSENEIIVGGLYLDYTGIMKDKIETTMNISDNIYHFNKLEAIYGSHRPTSNQNIFRLTLTDTTKYSNNNIHLWIFTRYVKPEDFFKRSTWLVDTITISWSDVSENFYNANVTLKWDTASIDNTNFTGTGSIEFNDQIGTIKTNAFYPKQKLNFKFD